MHISQNIKKYLLLLVLVLLMIPALLNQAGAGSAALGWQAFHKTVLPVLIVGWGLIFYCQKTSGGGIRENGPYCTGDRPASDSGTADF